MHCGCQNNRKMSVVCGKPQAQTQEKQLIQLFICSIIFQLHFTAGLWLNLEHWEKVKLSSRAVESPAIKSLTT